MLLYPLLLIHCLAGYNLVREIPVDHEPAHAIYLSVVQIDHSDLGPISNVLVKVFANDLEDVIRASYPDQYQPSAPATFCPSNKQWIGQYFQTHLVCEVNGQPATLSFLSGKPENEVYWLTFSLKAPDDWKKVEIRASFFMEIFATQSNIIHLLNGSERRFVRLVNSAAEVIFEF